MSALAIALWAAAGVAALFVFLALVRGGKPLRSAVAGGVRGLAALLAVDAAGIFTGVSLGLNALTGGVCLVLGVPGVIGLLLMKTIFQIG